MMADRYITSPCSGLKPRTTTKRRLGGDYSTGPTSSPKWKFRVPDVPEEELKALVAKMKSQLANLDVVDICSSKPIWVYESEVAKRGGLTLGELRKLRFGGKVRLFTCYADRFRCRLETLRAFERKYKR